MMKKELHVLFVEDNEDDYLLIQRALKKEGFTIVSQRVDTKETFIAALDAHHWDVILSDYAMPLFNGMDALEILLDHASDPPFIIVSGELGEERAVALLKAGADDYIRKDNLVRLGQAVKRALEQRDIQRKKTAAEKALTENEERFRAIADFTHDWEIWVDPDGNIKWVNPAVERITGYTQEEYIALGKKLGQRLKYVIHKADFDFIHDSILNGLKNQTSGNDIHFRIVTKYGQQKWCSISFQPIYSAKGEFLGVRSSIRDISGRKKAEEDLEASEERYRLVFENSPLGIMQFDENGVIVDCNENFAQIIGLSKDRLVGVNMLESMPEDPERDTLIEALSKRSGQYEGKFKTFNGIKDIRAIKSTITDKDGNVRGAVGIFEDITEQVRLETHLNQVQKMESIGNLAGGIAHDFNNLLFPIMGISEMLLDDLPEGSDEHQSVAEILKAAKRGSELVKQILPFSRKSDSKKVAVQFQSIIEETLKLSRSIIPTSVNISSDIKAECLIEANPSQLHQVLMNLITNAYHALENASGTIDVQIHEVVMAQSDIVMDSIKPGAYAKLTISDTGTGINPDILEKIFEPYFTTKEKGKGTGLGLAMVYGIIKNHHGDIRVSSEPGKGSVFSIYLPLMKKVSENQHDPKINHMFSTGNETILLVDDEQSILQMEKKILERMGYRVMAMTDSMEALEVFKANPQNFDLIISDMTMPNVTGDQLAKELIAIRPDIPVIISTGFSERLNEEQAEQMGIKAFLMKPVSRSEMARTIREILEKKWG